MANGAGCCIILLFRQAKRYEIPQITLRLSANAKGILTQEDFNAVFHAINSVLENTVLDIDISSCNSGVIFEEFSFMNRGDPLLAKCYDELLWMESSARVSLKKIVADHIMEILGDKVVPLLAD